MAYMRSQRSLPNRPSSKTLRRVALSGLGTALPENHWSQRDVFRFIEKRFQISNRSKAIYKKILHNPSIQSRSFSIETLEQVLQDDPNERSKRFEKEAVALSTQSLKKALKNAGVSPKSLDFLIVTTCTGYLCPGLSAYLVESCDLRQDIHYADLVGMGCGAAIPALEQARNFLLAHPGSTAAVVSTEICSAAFYDGEELDLIISNALFGDGSAAIVLRNQPSHIQPDRNQPLQPKIIDFGSITIPEWRDGLRFRSKNGLLRNILSKDVPVQSGKATRRLIHRLLGDNGIQPSQISHWVVHAGGEKVLGSIETELALPKNALKSSRRILEKHGNLSSPTVLFVLSEEERNHPGKEGELMVMTSFGAGFSAHAALLEY